MQQLTAGKHYTTNLAAILSQLGRVHDRINTLTACTYHRNTAFLKVNRDLMGPIGEKIAE
jgi:hypothetical protein